MLQASGWHGLVLSRSCCDEKPSNSRHFPKRPANLRDMKRDKRHLSGRVACAYRLAMKPRIELSRAETTLMRKCIMPLLSHGDDGPPDVHGTCEVLATFGRRALALTARHVLDEIARADGSYDEQLHMPDILRGARKDSNLRKRHIGAAYQLTEDTLCTVRFLRGWVSQTHDVALCLLELGPDAPPDAGFEVRMAVSFAPLVKGQEVQIGGYSSLARKRNPTASALEVPLDIELQLGTVLEVHHPFRFEQKAAGPVCTIDCRSTARLQWRPLGHSRQVHQ